GPFNLAPLTIPNNGTSVMGTATVTGASGSGTIIIPAVGLTESGATFLSTTSNVIVVLPSAVPSLKINDDFLPIPTATGVRSLNYVRIPSPAPAGGVPINITNSDPSRVQLSACNPNDSQTTNCTGDALAAGVALTIPQGSTFARFDLIGLTSAFTD